jgi:hypothetical protein
MEATIIILSILLVLSIGLIFRLAGNVLRWKKACYVWKNISKYKDITILNNNYIIKAQDATIKSYKNMLANGIIGSVLNENFAKN